MKKTTLNFADASAEVVTIENLIYVPVFGIFTDAVAMELIRFMEPIIAQIPVIPIRVWDASGVPAMGFKLSSGCIDKIAEWERKIRSQKPDSLLYMIAPTLISYGMARMFQMKSDPQPSGIFVLNKTDELPAEVREKLSL